MERAEVVIVGGGIIGASIAYHLAKRGVKDVVLLERELFFGAESTAKCAGGIRAQFTTPINIQLSLLSIKHFETFSEEMGLPVDFRQVGYMFMSPSAENWELAKQNAELQRRWGVPVEALTPDRVKERVPELETGDLVGAHFCPIDGLGDPHGFLQGYLKVARQLGVRVLNQRPVTGFVTENGRITAVETPQGTLSAGLVINAAGAWAGQLGKLLGVDIPVVPVRRHIATTSAMPWIDPSWPMMIDNGSGVYMHPEGSGLLMGLANKAEPAAFNTNLDEDFIGEIVMAAIARMPRLEEGSVASAWAGLYEVTPDHHAIIGYHPEVSNLIVAAGFSGHGFMQAPATGQLVAELILDGKPSIDLSPLRIERFSENHAVHELMVI
ncbi:4-methylaminobutanoate oxidase (formaldehyde-forming) [compost metagenome]